MKKLRYIYKPKLLMQGLINKGLLNHFSDKKFIIIKGYLNLNRRIDIKNPKTLNEKLQWLKLNNRNPELTKLVDKYEVKFWIEENYGKEYVVENYGVWESYEDIEFDQLPDEFVLKCTHDSGGLVVCDDKNTINHKKSKKKIEESLKTNYYLKGREWPYKNVKPRIIAEKYLKDREQSLRGIVDYKFFCFNGKPELLYVSEGLDNHETAGISFYDTKLNLLDFRRLDYKPIEELKKPKKLKEMLELSESIANQVDSPFIRVDLYEIDGHIYVSELTFYPCSGYIPFEPKEYDMKLGELLDIEGD